MRLIYLDTKVWNMLAAEDVDQEKLAGRMQEIGQLLAISNFNRVELEQTYFNGERTEGAKRLLRCLRDAQAAGAAYIKDPVETVAAEMWALKEGGPVRYLYSKNESELHGQEVGRCSLDVDESRLSELYERREINQAERRKLASYVVSNVVLRNELRSVPRVELKEWLASKTQSSQGISVLSDILQGRFSDIPRDQLAHYARELLVSPIGMASRAMVKANIYVFWRYAAQDVVGQPAERSLFDDTYQVVNAAYCDSYVTCDAKQSKYLGLILPRDCRGTLLERSACVSEFLVDGDA